MAEYMGMRIIDEAFTYEFVISNRPELKEGIDEYLRFRGFEHLIIERENTE